VLDKNYLWAVIIYIFSQHLLRLSAASPAQKPTHKGFTGLYTTIRAALQQENKYLA
jgi:hypothetical protein